MSFGAHFPEGGWRLDASDRWLTQYQLIGIIPIRGYGRGPSSNATRIKNETSRRGPAGIRSKGYSAATIEDICQTAGLTKGSFFHHFKSKEELALAAAGHFAAMADSLFAQAPYRALPDPLDRLLGYVDFRRSILKGSLPEYTCLLGMMVQEAFETHPAIRQVCDRHISAHAAEVAKDIAEAKLRYAPDAAWSAESLGLYTQGRDPGRLHPGQGERRA